MRHGREVKSNEKSDRQVHWSASLGLEFDDQDS